MSPLATAAAPATDFVLVQAVAGPEGAGAVTITITGRVHQSAPGALVAGGGFGVRAGNTHGGSVSAGNVASSGVVVTANRGLGGFSLSVGAPASLVYDFTGGGTVNAGALAPGDQVDMLVFFPNGGVDSAQVEARTESGSVNITRVDGGGSRTLDVATAGDGGTGVALEGVAVGSTTHAADAAKGLVGTVIAPNCFSACAGSWTTPDDRSGAWSVPTDSPAPPSLTNYQFTGPPGAWTWTWSGSEVMPTASSADFAAYCPLGDDWPLFSSGTRS
jgi:hypothetical protein